MEAFSCVQFVPIERARNSDQENEREERRTVADLLLNCDIRSDELFTH